MVTPLPPSRGVVINKKLNAAPFEGGWGMTFPNAFSPFRLNNKHQQTFEFS